jgi:hypothetical protein
MMLSNRTVTFLRRLVVAALILGLLLPSSARIGLADDEPTEPPIDTPGSQQIQPAPPGAQTVTGPSTTPPQSPAGRPVPSRPAPTPGATPTGTEDADQQPQQAPGGPLAPCKRPERIEATAWRLEGDDALNNMRGAIGDTLQRVEVRERGLTGEIPGFRAGANYSHIYARDSATIAPAAQFLYDLPYLTRPVEEFLALQYDGDPDDAEDLYWKTPGQPGAISGTIGGGEIAGAKMLVVSDEESSVISMAYVAVRAGAGPAWLRGAQAGKPRIDRLNRAMDWLFENRYDQKMRVVKRGNTTDWGDVVVGQGNSSGSYTKEPVEWTSSIYDQAWTYRALLQLAEMNTLVGKGDMAEKQVARARTLRQSVVEQFWQPDRGYFRTRLLLPPLAPEIDEDRIVSIANGVAVYAGITDPTVRKQIFTALEAARLAAGGTKPGLSLWPPYPLGYFDYPQMIPGRYQNGAVWDWWGGMQISGQFWTGYSGMGRQNLALVAADWAREPGEVYEWQELRSGKNFGSPAYAGAASTMAEAIITGLYGVELTPRTWAITPRLGSQSGGIHVFQPTSGCVVDYWQTYAGDRIAIEWETNHTIPGQVTVLLPDATQVTSALLDGKPVRTSLQALGDDVLAVLGMPAPAGKHRLELRLGPDQGN